MWKVDSVKNWRFKKSTHVILIAVAFALITLWFPRLACWVQASQAKLPESVSSEDIHITSDRLVIDNQARAAEFSGRVRAVQGTFVINSDSLKIYYRTTEEAGTTLSEDSDSIERIVAQGNVKILMDEKVATTSEAEYRTDTQVLVLSGPGSKIVSENNSITGSKITFYRVDERVIVEGQADKRVEAQFFSNPN